MNHQSQHLNRLLIMQMCLMTALVGPGCGKESTLPEDELVVLTRNAPTVYFIDRNDRVSGPEHEMAEAFAESLNVPVRFDVMDSVGDLLEALEQGDGHLAAAGLTRTPERERLFLSGPTYQKVDELVVCAPGIEVHNEADLANIDLDVVANSSYVETLGEIHEHLPALEWDAVPNVSSEELLKSVSDGSLDCTVADSHIVAMHRRYLPEVEGTFSLQTGRELAWLLPPDASELQAEVNAWFERYEASGELAAMMDRYYGYLDQFDPYDVKVFEERVETRLPTYRQLFEEASEESGFPWTFLAAVSYQESSWNPNATSPTGVEGMMMLTKATAESVGITDRTDPAASISGGARYLRRMVDRVPSSIPDQERLWMALAAYNLGYSHLRDARMLAVYLGRNPNLWSPVKGTLPLLSEGRYYRLLPNGYAKGVGASVYVERIRHYQDLLTTLQE